VQIEKDAQVLGAHCNLSIQAIYGGVDYMKQKNALKDGADVVMFCQFGQQWLVALRWVAVGVQENQGLPIAAEVNYGDHPLIFANFIGLAIKAHLILCRGQAFPFQIVVRAKVDQQSQRH